MIQVSREVFEGLVESALAEVPPAFREVMTNVQIEVRARPGREARGLGSNLLGLYFGPPRQELASPFAGALPPGRIVLYQRNLEALAQDEASLRHEIAATLRHEIGHHLGLDERRIRRTGH